MYIHICTFKIILVNILKMKGLTYWFVVLIAMFFVNKVSSFEIPKHLLPKTSAEVQTEAVLSLIKRTIGDDKAQQFDVKVDKTLPFRNFQITKTGDGKIVIVGSDGVSVAKGFHHYLKYYLYKDVTWTETRNLLPQLIDLPNVTISSTSASTFIYYQNVCTWSYSFAWWQWSTWRVHIDWMAMMGITLTIAPIQEQIWHEMYTKMGLTELEIREHFAGPAFQAWQRMGNIRGWAGPLPTTYRRSQLLLQRKIIKAQRELGITVALPAFAGHVPRAMSRIYPNATLTPVERWNHFSNKSCCSLFLDPNEPLFSDIGAEFLQRTIDAYNGTNHIYFADPFNEIQPHVAETTYVKQTSAHIFESMRNVDDASIWLLQGWMFVNNVFWTDAFVKAFLTAVPRGRMLVLDLQSEQLPQYERTESFYGQPWIWCMLHNFGGTLGMHGSVDVINHRVNEARKMVNSSMIGVGITPEGINQNYVMYSFALERAWLRDNLELELWFNTFADARYGVRSNERLRTGWQLLRRSVYSYQGIRNIRGKYAITRRPALNLDIWTWYNASDVYTSWRLLLEAYNSISSGGNNNRYEYDLVDVTRQFLQLTADRLYVNIVSAYKKQQLERLTYISEKLINLLDDLEQLLSSNKHFLLGCWITDAKQMAVSPLERRLYELNARNQITSWGPRGQILDYATKQWSGIVRDYYRPRWILFLSMLETCVRSQKRFNSSEFKEIVSSEIENPFSVQTTVYPIEPVGSSFDISLRIFKSWTALMESQVFLHHARLNVKVL